MPDNFFSFYFSLVLYTKKETRLVLIHDRIYAIILVKIRYFRGLIQLSIAFPISSTKMPDNFFPCSLFYLYYAQKEKRRKEASRCIDHPLPVSSSITRLIKNRWIKGTYKHSWKMSDTGNGRRKAGGVHYSWSGRNATVSGGVCLKVCSLEASQSLCVSIDSY